MVWRQIKPTSFILFWDARDKTPITEQLAFYISQDQRRSSREIILKISDLNVNIENILFFF